jgi:hypothetical protein
VFGRFDVLDRHLTPSLGPVVSAQTLGLALDEAAFWPVGLSLSTPS